MAKLAMHRNYRTTISGAHRCIAFVLAVIMLFSMMTSVAYAAEEKVTGIQFDYDSSDYNSDSSSLQLFVDDEKIYLDVLATIEGSTSKKDVTSLVTWKSSNTNHVKVDKGVLTGIGNGTATISATYKDYKITIKATSDYVYDSVALMDNNATAPGKAEGEIGKTYTYKLNGLKNGLIEDITAEATWTSSSSSVAKVNEGTVTFVGTGTTTITAKYKGKSDSIAITVSSPYKSIKLSPREQIEMEVGGDDLQLTATAVLKIGETENITEDANWTVANANIVTVEDGLVNALAAGKTSITVSHKGMTSTVDVIVRTNYQSIRLSPEKEHHMFIHHQPLQVQAEVLNNANVSYDATQMVDWKNSDPLVATVSKGLVTPKAVGTTKITASYKGVSRSMNITVYPSIRDITVESDTINAFLNSSEKLPAVTGKLFDGSTIDVSKLAQWTSKDDKITVIEEGKWVAKQVGETILTAKIGIYEADVKLIVNVKPMKLIPKSSTMNLIIGKEVAYPTITVVNENGEKQDVTDKVTWKSSSEDLILMPTKIRGTETATATLTATYLNKSTNIKVRIEEEIVKLKAEPEVLELNPNRSKSIKITGYYKDGRTVVLSSKVELSTTSTTLVSIKGRTVKALTTGSGVITGTYQDKTISIPVIVTPKLKSLSLSDKSVTLKAGNILTVKLTANYVTGSPADVTEQAIWTTSKGSVATVKDGKITAVGKGNATIKASFGGKNTTIRIVVK